MTALPVLIVHGGAGGLVPGAAAATRIDAGLDAALDAGLAVIEAGALAAVVAAVRVLEDTPCFNAGHGAVLTSQGTVELDAAVMEGTNRRTGAVTVVRDVANPVDLAHAILDDGRHVLLAADGASRFAEAAGVPLCDPASLIAAARPAATGNTVGAVCWDVTGHVAVAVSTGGTPGQLPGRVGDSPICGAGFYADDRYGAACATGDGEAFIRAQVCGRVIDAISAGDTAPAAIDALLVDAYELGGTGGVISVDAAGHVTAAHTSKHMSWAARDLNGSRGRWAH
jgi:beta-aspartyl-peptidase (threonine type)